MKPLGYRERRRVRRRPGYLPFLEGLEDRLVLDAASKAALFNALETHRYWIDYAPSYDSPTAPYNANPSDQRITADLKTLYDEGWRGLVTYTILGSYSDIPRIAKSVGFQYVIAGVFDPKNPTEVAAASSPNVLPYADAFVVGNEGLQDGRYNLSQLTSAVAQVKNATGKPVTTSEPGGQYYTGSPNSQPLLHLGDWLFPNIDYFLWDFGSGPQTSTPQQMWTNVSFFYQFALNNNATGGPVVAKESFYPTAGGSVGGGATASDANQIAWYGQEASTQKVNGQPFLFVWGEAFDQPWKGPNLPGNPIAPFEPHMGLHGLNVDGAAQPKPIIAALKPDYTSTTVGGPSTFTASRGQAVTLYDVVKPAPGGGIPTGMATFVEGTTILGSAPLMTANGQTFAALPIATLGLGLHTITAVYSGDANNQWDIAPAFVVAVGPDATTVKVGPSDFAPVRGESLAINAIVSVVAPGAGAPTGTVTFKSGATVLATEPVLSAVGLFYARLPAVPFGIGNYAITAVYNGDAGDAPSAATTTFTVGPDRTTTIAGPSTFTPVARLAIALNAIVSVEAPGSGTPTGTVTFRYGSNVVGVAPLKTFGGLTYASLPLPPLGVATYTFTATYNGDAWDLPSTGSTTFLVKPRPIEAKAAAVALAAPAPAPAAVTPPLSTPPAPTPAPATAAARFGIGSGQSKPRRAWLIALDSLDTER